MAVVLVSYALWGCGVVLFFPSAVSDFSFCLIVLIFLWCCHLGPSRRSPELFGDQVGLRIQGVFPPAFQGSAWAGLTAGVVVGQGSTKTKCPNSEDKKDPVHESICLFCCPIKVFLWGGD